MNFLERQFRVKRNNPNQDDHSIEKNSKNQDDLTKRNNTNENDLIKMKTYEDDDFIDLVSDVANPVNDSTIKTNNEVDQELDDDYYEYDLNDEDFELSRPYQIYKFLAKLIKRIAKAYTSFLRIFQSTSENEFFIRLYIAYRHFMNIFRFEEFMNPKGY